MKQNRIPDEIFDKFLKSDPAFIKSLLDEFTNLIAEGPSVKDYFKNYDSEFNYLNKLFSEFGEGYSSGEEILFKLDQTELLNTARFEVKTTSKETTFEFNHADHNNYALAA